MPRREPTNAGSTNGAAPMDNATKDDSAPTNDATSRTCGAWTRCSKSWPRNGAPAMRKPARSWNRSNASPRDRRRPRRDRLAAQVADALAEAEADSRENGAPARALRTSCGPHATVGAANAESSPRPNGPTARQIRASSSPRSPPARMTSGVWTKTSAASAARWRTASRTPTRPVRRWRLGARHARQPTPPARFASIARVLLCAQRRLAHTRLAAATCGSLRLEPLEIAVWVRIGVRRIEIAMDTNHPFLDEFRTARKRSPAAAA